MTKKISYPRWVGVLLALLLPGSAHYFSGCKAVGLRWFISLLLLSCGALILFATPGKTALLFGFLVASITLILNLIMLVRSYRPVQRLGLRGWAAYVILIFLGSVTPDPIKTYKLPTGSMQPTLRGITTDDAAETTSFIDWIVFGKKYVEIRATATGRIENIRSTKNGFSLSIGGELHNLPWYALDSLRSKPHITAGDILWSGTVHGVDHIIVDKIFYWIRKPQRGDIVVFSTEGIDHPDVRQGSVFVKRIVALPGDTISIKPPHILINGEPLTDPASISRFDYCNAGQLSTPSNSITLSEDEFFVLGDNTAPGRSLDSRYYGAIPRGSILGKVSSIYWPFTRMGGVE